MATMYLLTSEDRIKSITNISDNLSGKYLQSAIREAQEFDLKGIIGPRLLRTLKGMGQTGEWQPDYQDLVDEAQDFLAYTAIAKLPMMVSYKVTNFGLAKSADENLQVATMDEIVANIGYYQAKADSACFQFQNWLLAHRALFPELDDCACSRIKANLTEAATCGIWLGGVRGKEVRR